MRSVSEARAVRKMIGIVRQFGIVANALADVQAVGIGQHDIEQDEVGTHLAAKIQRALPVCDPRETKALFFQVVLQQREEIGVVFDQHNFFHLNNRCSQG